MTMEFLISLAIKETGADTKVNFRIFNEQFVMKLKDFSIAFGFHKRCILDPNELAKKHRYDRNSWWSAISNEPVSSKNNIVSIHNPTLRFLAKWLAMVMHPCADLPLQLARVAVPVRHGKANSLLSSQNHARSLAEDDLRQKPHRYDLPGHC